MFRVRVVPAVLLLVLCSLPIRAAVLVVDRAGGGDFTDIQSALDAASAGDTIVVHPGEYVIREPLDFNRTHDPFDPASPR